MSLQELILNEFKPWLNARVNNLQLDGSLLVNNLSVQSISFPSPYNTPLSKYEEYTVPMRLSGPFEGGLPVDINIKFIRLNNEIIMEGFQFLTTGSGSPGIITNLILTVPINLRPTIPVGCIIQTLSFDGTTKNIGVFTLYTDGTLQIQYGTSPGNFPGGVGNGGILLGGWSLTYTANS